MRIVSRQYGIDIPYEGTALAIENKYDGFRGSTGLQRSADPRINQVDMIAYGSSIPNGRTKIGTFGDIKDAKEALADIHRRFITGGEVFYLPLADEGTAE